MNDNLTTSISFQNKNNTWIQDNMVSKCHKCGTFFGFLVRKHHCRNCGNIFCYNCCNDYIAIPDFIKDKPNAEDYWNISYYITYLKSTTDRVCKFCYNIILEKNRTFSKIIEIMNHPISIEDINSNTNLDQSVKHHYNEYLRNIQYYLPNRKYSDIDKNMLLINGRYFSKHSKYLVHLIKSIDWKIHKDNDEMITLIVDIINNDKNKTCNQLFCTRTCQAQFSCDDCINILYKNFNDIPDVILEYLFKIISLTPEDIIICNILFFVNMVPYVNENTLLITLLYKLLSTSNKIIYHTYWLLTNIKDQVNLEQIQKINNFLQYYDKDLVKVMLYEYMFFVGLINNLENPQKYLVDVFNTCKNIHLPYNPDIILQNVHLDSIVIKNSYTKPVMITFDTNYGKKRILFKKESIINDMIVLNLMILCDVILCDTLKKKFDYVVYHSMPLTENSGMIEIVDNACTIHTITNNNESILQYIIKKNENRIVKDIMDRYMYSLISYTLQSYFLGLGDRHLQNIMITDDSAIFHIDFGFILGSDAYPLTGSDIKLNSDMLDVIGKIDGDRYRAYLENCSKGAIVLRKHFNIFFILLSQNNKFSEKIIENFVMNRFQPRQSDSAIVESLMTVINKSNNAYSETIRDFLHYHTQEKTLQHGINAVFNTACSAVKNISGNL